MEGVGWGFPLTDGGIEGGHNESGISYFQANPIKSLTREVIQDSLDARKDTDKPVLVKFEQKKLSREAIPEVNELTSIFHKAKKYHEKRSVQTFKFLDKGHNLLLKETVSVLAIRDFNTTGLTKIKEDDGHFHKLTKTSGDTSKTGTANGSYGIGKHAPFAASNLRTMLYGTLNIDKEDNKGLQGVIKIASFKDEGSSSTQGTGFFGIKKRFMPLTDLSELNSFFVRKENEFGTDKFIIGFLDVPDWEEIIIEESISNYMLAIINGDLEIKVGNHSITQKSLSRYIDYVMKNNSQSSCLQFYSSLTSANKIVKENLFKTENGSMEKIKLYLIKDISYSKKISLVRGTGMKIYEKGHFRTPEAFAGTLVVEGNELNKVLRLMEPPTHDDWIPEIYKDNIDYASNLKSEILKWLREEINNLVPKNEKDYLELPGLDSILPSLDKEEKTTEDVSIDSTSEKTKSIKVVTNSMNKSPLRKRKISKAKGGRGKGKGTGTKGSGKGKGTEKNKTVELKNVRAFCFDEAKGLYQIVVSPKKSGDVSLKINLVGESITESAMIYDAYHFETNEKITTSNNTIGPVTLTDNRSTKILIKLDSNTRYALEVLSE